MKQSRQTKTTLLQTICRLFSVIRLLDSPRPSIGPQQILLTYSATTSYSSQGCIRQLSTNDRKPKQVKALKLFADFIDCHRPVRKNFFLQAHDETVAKLTGNCNVTALDSRQLKRQTATEPHPLARESGVRPSDRQEGGSGYSAATDLTVSRKNRKESFSVGSYSHVE